MSNPSRWMLIKRFAEVIGYSENAVRHKLKGGVWIEGRIFVNVGEFERWVESNALARAF